MTFFEFTMLPHDKQYDLVFTEGDFIADRKVGYKQFVLYKLYGFLVEIEYDILRNNIVRKVVSKKSTRL